MSEKKIGYHTRTGFKYLGEFKSGNGPRNAEVHIVEAKTEAGRDVFLYGRYIWKDPSKYMPHQGERECARRRRQMGIHS